MWVDCYTGLDADTTYRYEAEFVCPTWLDQQATYASVTFTTGS